MCVVCVFLAKPLAKVYYYIILIKGMKEKQYVQGTQQARRKNLMLVEMELPRNWIDCIESWRVQYIGVRRPRGGGALGETLGWRPLVPWPSRQAL
jgi:hypothetical protein